MTKLAKGDTIKFEVPWGIKEGKVVSIKEDIIEVQTMISLWTISKSKITENKGKL